MEIDRGRDARHRAPPAQNRTCGFPAYGSHLGYLTAKRPSLLPVRDRARGTGFPGSASGACRAQSRSPRPLSFAPPTPRTVPRPRSPASPGVCLRHSSGSLLWKGLTSHGRASPASALRPSRCGPSLRRRPAMRSPGSRARGFAGVPRSTTTRDRQGTGDSAPRHVAFRYADSVGIPDQKPFAAQYLAHQHPCQRFVPDLAA